MIQLKLNRVVLMKKKLGEKSFASKNKFKEFPDVEHGWMTRPDLVGNVARDYSKGLADAIEFFKANIPTGTATATTATSGTSTTSATTATTTPTTTTTATKST